MEPGTTTPINKNSTPLRRQTPRKTNSPFKRTGPLFPKTPSRTPDGSLQLCRHLCLQKNLCKHKYALKSRSTVLVTYQFFTSYLFHRCCKRGMFDSNGEPISADSVTELTEESDEENENALQNYISINERYNLITPIRHTKTTETSFQETKMDVEQQETPSRISNSSLPHIEANLMSM